MLGTHRIKIPEDADASRCLSDSPTADYEAQLAVAGSMSRSSTG
jgi:hypothetical protein